MQSPSLKTLSAGIVAQLEKRMGAAVQWLPRSFEHVLSKALAGVNATCFRYSSWMFFQVWPQYASFEEVEIAGKRVRPLLELGRLRGVDDPTEATHAVLTVSVPVTTQSGSLDAGTVLLRGTTDMTWTTVAAVPLDAATVTATIRAQRSGTAGNLQVGDDLRFAGTPANVASAATVASVVTTAIDAESVESYRARVVAAGQDDPEGGAPLHYRTWALEVPGIIAAYPYKSTTAGHVDIFIEASAATAEDTDGTPTDAQMAAVESAILLDSAGVATRKPVNDAANVQSIWRTGFDVGIADLDWTINGTMQGPMPVSSRTELRARITAALDEFLRSRKPSLYLDPPPASDVPRKDVISQGEIAGVVYSVTSDAGGTVGVISLLDHSEPYQLQPGECAKLGEVVWT